MDITPKILRDELIKMAGLIETILHKALDPETTLDSLLKLEQKVDQFHTSIDDLVFKFIALKRPAARDLREALSIMKMNTDFERMADQAIVIKRYWDQSEGQHPDILKMDQEVHSMVRNCIDAFVHHNTSLAEQTIKDDRVINQINKDLAIKYIEEMKSDTISFEEGFALIRVIKNLERIADLSTNIAEDVIFLERGMDVRHLDPERKINHNEKN